MPDLVVSVSDAAFLDVLGPLPDGITGLVWDIAAPPSVPRINLVVSPYIGDWRMRLPAVAAVRPRLVQSQMLGDDGVAEVLPSGVDFTNAVGVPEISTAELAVGRTLASLRRIDACARQAAAGSQRVVWGLG